MFEVNGKEYELKFNMQRIEMIEAVTKMPTLASIQRGNGMFSISDLKAYFGYSVKEPGSDVFMPPKKGMELCEELMNSEGYIKVTGVVLEALERDCTFFFQES